MEQLSIHSVPRDIRKYAFVGYPASKAKVSRPEKRVSSSAYAYLASSAEPSVYAELGLREQYHIVLPFDAKNIYQIDGRKMNFPKPAGISGTPLWELHTADAGGPRIVGVMIEVRKKHKALIATDIGVVVRMLADYYGIDVNGGLTD